MKIILIKDVKKQGKSGDILEVKDGYGTFLINKGDAVLATSNSVGRLDRENKEKEVKIEKLQSLVSELKAEVNENKDRLNVVSNNLKVLSEIHKKSSGCFSLEKIIDYILNHEKTESISLMLYNLEHSGEITESEKKQIHRLKGVNEKEKHNITNISDLPKITSN